MQVAGRSYRLPDEKLVVVCLDGCDPSYLDAAFDAGVAPTLARFTRLTGRCVLPSFTNPNNVSIVTGAPPSVHGICGNFFLDERTGEPSPLNKRVHMRCGTILDALVAHGKRVLSITVKDKLMELVAARGGLACSIEKPSDLTRSLLRDVPSIYEPEATVALLDAGVAALDRDLADVLYLSSTDYVQHHFAPRDAEALRFMGHIDAALARLSARARVAITADHGMNAKHRADGSPNVVYLAEHVAGRVILPITDPHVVHHAALGSAATIYTRESGDVLREIPGVERVLTREEAARELELPADRIGDLFVLADRHSVLGTRREEHDLGALRAGTRENGEAFGLRSHGGAHEQSVPLMFDGELRGEVPSDLRNFDVFDLALNRLASRR